MLRTAVDERRCPRTVAVHHRFPEGRPGHPLIVNASQGGACVWFANPPQESQAITLRFTANGNDRVLHSHIVWSRPCAATTSPSYLKRAVGWLVGIAFVQAEADVGAADLSHELLRDGHVTINIEKEQASTPGQNLDTVQQPSVNGLIVPDEKSMQSFKTATRDLIPLFAKHFADVHVVLKQQQLEISATFRDQHQAEQAREDSTRTRLPESAADAPAKPARLASTQSIDSTEKNKFSSSRRRALIAFSGVAVIAAAVVYKGVLPRRQAASSDLVAGAGAAQRDVPAWASTVGASLVGDWIEVKSTFGLSDAAVRSLIELLQHNEIYPPAHDLYDLAKYPRQVGRAFKLIGSQPGAETDRPALGKLKNDLESRLIAGARFPDEPPGGRYSSLQRELYNNVVVLGVIDQLHRRQDDPAVRQLLTSIIGSKAKANTLAAAPSPTPAILSK